MRKAIAIMLDDVHRQELEQLTRSRTTAVRLAGMQKNAKGMQKDAGLRGMQKGTCLKNAKGDMS